MPTVLVSGVGAIIGYGIIRSLRQSRYPVKIIGMDIYPDAIGQQWCDVFEQAPFTSSPEYAAFLQDLIQQNQVDLFIPGIVQDVTYLAANRKIVGEWTRLALNQTELIQLGDDKWNTHQALVAQGFDAIPTFIEGDYSQLRGVLGSPFLMKPRRSYASKGITRIDSEADYQYWQQKLGDNFMVQQIVGTDEDEYTVSTFGLGDGSALNTLMMSRRLSGEGSTAKARVIEDKALEALVRQLVECFRPIGPTNFQFRKHQGRFLLLEINPRISSATSLRTAFGVNESEMCLEYFYENKIPTARQVQSGTAVRYIEDYILPC